MFVRLLIGYWFKPIVQVKESLITTGLTSLLISQEEAKKNKAVSSATRLRCFLYLGIPASEGLILHSAPVRFPFCCPNRKNHPTLSLRTTPPPPLCATTSSSLSIHPSVFLPSS